MYNEWGATVNLIDGRGFESIIDHDAFGRPSLLQDSDGKQDD